MGEGFLVEIGKRVLEKRKMLRLSQEELAEKADTSKQTISMVEHGKRELSTRTIVGLAKALGMSTDYLLTGQCTNEDVLLLQQKVSGLTARQYRYLETLIWNFIDMCEEGAV